MFWQTKITPTTADPAQQRMMMIMPLMFTVLFLWAPSGLVIYWFVEQPLGDRTAVLHELDDRTGRRRSGSTSGGASVEDVGAGRTGGASKKS